MYVCMYCMLYLFVYITYIAYEFCIHFGQIAYLIMTEMFTWQH